MKGVQCNEILGGIAHENNFLFCYCASEDMKRRKYVQLVAVIYFVPMAVETSWIIGFAGYSLQTDIDRRTSRATNDAHQTSYIYPQISVAIIRGNALAITSSLNRFA